MPDWIGTRLSADINLGAQLAMLVGLWIGFYFAHTGRIRKHRNTQTTMVLTNMVVIVFFMGYSFWNFVIAGGTTGGVVARLMMAHGILGILAEGSGIYLILRMRTQVIPPRFRVQNFKPVMQSTLGLWTILVLMGVGVYYYRYLEPSSKSPTAPLIQLERSNVDLVIHALELRDAVDRGNLRTSRRHAEHLVNLIEGEGGGNYGDVDGDGSLEDPGDGTGLLTYLEEVDRAAEDKALRDLVDDTEALLRTIDLQSMAVIQAADLSEMNSLAQDIFSLANRASVDGIKRIDALAGEQAIAPQVVDVPVVPGAAGEPRTLTVNLDRFQFKGSSITIQQGWTVEWINREAPNHTATAADDSFNSGTMSQGDTFTFTFNETGTFPYYCRFHGDNGGVGMAGTIIVQ